MKQSLKWCLLLGMHLIALAGVAQDSSKNYLPVVVGFYNLENLYDTVDNKLVADEEFLPNSEKRYNTRRYEAKLTNMAEIISKIGTQYNQDGPALLGCVEIENDTVLTDLVLHPLLESRGYQFVQFDSPDGRGIDVALLYQPAYFRVLHKEAIKVDLPEQYPTRDILWVQGLLLGDTVNVIVNHWPSRRANNAAGDMLQREVDRRNNMSRPQGTGNYNPNTVFEQPRSGSTGTNDGTYISEPNRIKAAETCKALIDRLHASNNSANIIVMGDFNDDPENKSISKVLAAQKDMAQTATGNLYNPFAAMHQKGFGTLAYGGKWNLFDQIMFSPSLLSQQSDLFLYKAHIYYEEKLVETGGEYKGYPKRSWVGNEWHNGYSDHLPVYTVLLKAAE